MRKILVIGANGMLGHSLFRYFDKIDKYIVKGTVRESGWNDKLELGYSCENIEKFRELFEAYRPDIVFNCIGIVKQQEESKNFQVSIDINSLFPHQLEILSNKIGSKLIHFSTDCVFSGADGNYTELSLPDATDLYGKTKFLGEVKGENSLTIRTSIIGHELKPKKVSLVDWFLGQKEQCQGYSRAIYSGFPTNSLARIIESYIFKPLFAGKLSGSYHLSSSPINKFELLQKISKVYGKDIKITANESFKIDRSLNSDLLKNIIGYQPESWDDLVSEMHDLYQELELS